MLLYSAKVMDYNKVTNLENKTDVCLLHLVALNMLNSKIICFALVLSASIQKKTFPTFLFVLKSQCQDIYLTN